MSFADYVAALSKELGVSIETEGDSCAYGTIPDLTTQDGNGPKRRLFLKCESHGCFHNPISKADQAAGMAPGMRQRASRDGDWSESILHGLSFLETPGTDPTAFAPPEE